MSDEETPADRELADARRSISATGESADSDEAGESESAPANPPLPDWGSDGLTAEEEPDEPKPAEQE